MYITMDERAGLHRDDVGIHRWRALQTRLTLMATKSALAAPSSAPTPTNAGSSHSRTRKAASAGAVSGLNV